MYDHSICISSHVVTDVQTVNNYPRALQLLCEGYAVTWGSRSVMVALNATGTYRIRYNAGHRVGRRFREPAEMRAHSYVSQPTYDEGIASSFMFSSTADLDQFLAIKLEPITPENYHEA